MLPHVENAHPLDASDVQELRVRVQRRQGVIYPEQEPRFRDLDRLALQGALTAVALSEAARTLSLFKQPGPRDRRWARAELVADLALSGGSCGQPSPAEVDEGHIRDGDAPLGD